MTSSNGDGNDETPRPVQIMSVGTAEDAYAFTFHEKEFLEILSRVPPGWKVSVVSVVGAFRTGKSFLLSWFLKYLHYHHKENCPVPELTTEDESADATEKEAKPWYLSFDSLDRSEGFHWQGGADRQTTGMWMWSEAFVVDKESGPLAVLLVDTQGMFDHDTTMGLTASIFGLSTLLSSYQIYNVDKRIQEDNLQQLALFSEYGRAALKDGDDGGGDAKKEDGDVAAAAPFQRMEFLVRDWQNFECDGEGEMEDLEKEMADYLASVLSERDAKDLKTTRDQITSCFSEITCFQLTHPGFGVTKKKYDGSTKDVDPAFLRLMSRYCERVLAGDNLRPKKIHGRELSAAELGAYVKAYAALFADGARFPEAGTMLEATARANNANAVETSHKLYKDAMDDVVGPEKTEFVKTDDLETLHANNRTRALGDFDCRADFGSATAIAGSRRDVTAKIDKDWNVYVKLNEGRNPFLGLEVVFVPSIVAFLSYIGRFVVDTSCSSWSQTCKASSDILSQVLSVVFLFLIIVLSTKTKQLAELYAKVRSAFLLFTGGGVGPTTATPKPTEGEPKKELKQD